MASTRSLRLPLGVGATNIPALDTPTTDVTSTPHAKAMNESLARIWFFALFLPAAFGCRAEMWIESPDERLAGGADTMRAAAATPVDTVYRPTPIDSSAASFAWMIRSPQARLTDERAFPETAVDAARQYLRALVQTGSSTKGTIGVGQLGYERAFTYVHPRVRGRRTAARWAWALSGIVRPAIVRLEPVPGDSTLVFGELLVLRDVAGESMAGLYYGHFAAAPGDNGWQLTGARFASEDWQSPLGGHRAWRYDRALAARFYAAEDTTSALTLVELKSGEWVPIVRLAPVADLRFGLPDLE